MNFKEFIEENNHKYKNMIFHYIYHIRDFFFSFQDIENCRREKYITPTKSFEIKDDKCYVKCVEGKKVLSFNNFIKRKYPMDKEIILRFKDKEFELDTCGRSDIEQDLWNYKLYES